MKTLKVFLMVKKEDWMTKEMGNEGERGRKGAGHGRRSVCVGGRETERERERRM